MFFVHFLMKPFDCKKDIIYLIRHLAKLLQADFDDRVAKFGLTGAQARILFYINRKTNIEHIEVHQKDIEQEFCLAKSTVNGLVSRLLKTGFIIKKNIHPYAVLETSESGIATIEKIHKGRDDAINKLFQGYTEEEKESTLERLNRLIDNLEGGKDNVAKD